MCIGYEESGGITTTGWYYIDSDDSFEWTLPFKYSKDEFYYLWQTVNYYDYLVAWHTGVDKYLWTETGGNTGFKYQSGKWVQYGGGYKVKKGFHKLKLNSETTVHSLKD